MCNQLLRTVKELVYFYGGREILLKEVIEELDRPVRLKLEDPKPKVKTQSNQVTGWGPEKEALLIEMIGNKPPDYIQVTLGLSKDGIYYRKKQLKIAQ